MDDIEAAYNNALDYLYSFVDFSLQKAITYSPDRFKLERIQKLVESLGNPQQSYPSIHVAGTKGKGSVSIFCASALQAAGFKVGLYTSPHLDDYAERIQVNGNFISHADLATLVEEIKPYVAAIPELTTFEITTALAFWYFARQNVTAAIIEVGLGGRLDATNVIIPEVSVITSISYDHTYLLGNTLPEIAGEKAGIIKQGVPVVSSPQIDAASEVIERIALERSAPFLLVGKDVLYEETSHSLENQQFHIWVPGSAETTSVNLSIPLLGSHQVDNAATAYTALNVFAHQGHPVEVDDIQRGFAKAFWPGRFEIASHEPPIVLDCAHNRDSALKLRLTMEKYFPGKPVLLIFGASEDKDIDGMLTELMPIVNELFLVKSFHPRAIDPLKLEGMAKPFGCTVNMVEHIPAALEQAMAKVKENEAILVTGSIFVVAEARKFLEKKENIRRY